MGGFNPAKNSKVGWNQNPNYIWTLNTLWQFNIAIEHIPFIVDLPINSMVIFHSFVYQRVIIIE